MKAWLYFILGFILVFAPAFAFCGTLQEVWKEKYSGIIFAYVEDDILKAMPGFEGMFLGYMPRNIIKEKPNMKFENDHEIIQFLTHEYEL